MFDLSDIYANDKSSDDRIKLMLKEDITKIKELLAQPEQENLTPRQGLEVYKKGYYQAELDLKREPLSDDVIADLWGDKYAGKTFMVRNFARAIEKAHGIGVDDE